MLRKKKEKKKTQFTIINVRITHDLLFKLINFTTKNTKKIITIVVYFKND